MGRGAVAVVAGGGGGGREGTKRGAGKKRARGIEDDDKDWARETVRAVAASLRREARSHNGKVPEVVVVAHEYDPRAAAAVARMRGPESGDGYDERQDREESRGGRGGGRGGGGSSRAGRGGGGRGRGRGSSARSSGSDDDGGGGGSGSSGSVGRRGVSRGGAAASSSSRRSAAAPSAVPAPEGVLRKRREANPREDPGAAAEKGIDISYG